MLKKLSWIPVATIVLSLGTPNVLAADSTPGLTAGEKIYVQNMAEGGIMEVKLGELAQKNASSQAVKDFGTRMVEDHTKAGEALKALAEKKGMTWSTDLSKSAKAELDMLSKKSGAAFDKAYMGHMLVDHKKDTALLKVKHKDADLQAWQAQTLPVVEGHLKLALDTNKQIAASRKSAGKKS